MKKDFFIEKTYRKTLKNKKIFKIITNRKNIYF